MPLPKKPGAQTDLCVHVRIISGKMTYRLFWAEGAAMEAWGILSV